MTAKRPQKIAILGGGVAAMAAAFELTNVPGWQQRHEITIYQMGWRLGGQCASGRGPNDRIEEHGLHVLLGCYENAFRMLRQCYAELDRDADSPLATWEQAFKPYHGIIFQEHIDGTSKLWPMDYPRNSALPGDGGLFPKPRDYFSAAVGFLRGFVRTLRRLQGRNRAACLADCAIPQRSCARCCRCAVRTGSNAARCATRSPTCCAVAPTSCGETTPRVLRTTTSCGACSFWSTFARRPSPVSCATISSIAVSMPSTMRTWSSGSCAMGRMRHTTSSAVVHALYTLVFATPRNGRPESGLAAGAALRTAIRIVCSYKGAVSYKMQAATGDTIFALLYLVLREPGVRFEFFQRVDRLGLAPDADLVETIHITRQAGARNSDYAPLVDVGGLPTWPATPCFDQLVNGRKLKTVSTDFEAAAGKTSIASYSVSALAHYPRSARSSARESRLGGTCLPT